MNKLNPPNILVVDDDDAKRYVVARTLRNEGFNVIEAPDGRSALAGVEQQPDLVVLDVRLPDISGLEVCRRIKTNPVTSRVLVMHLSATYVEAKDRVTGLDCGADAYLSDETNPLELVATVRALLRARNAEQAASETEQRFRTLIEALPQMVWTTLPDGQCDYLSSQWVTYTGIPAADQLGMRWLEPLHPADRQRVEQNWQAATSAATDYEIEYRLRRADGAYRWFKSRALPMRDPSGKIVRWLGTTSDIHAGKEAEEERAQLLAREQTARSDAETANRLKDEFLATLSHELRTPLMAIMGWAEILRHRGNDEKLLKDGLATIDRNAQTQAQLIDDLLDVSRIISGKLRLDVQPTSLSPVIHAAVESLRTAADAKEVTIQLLLDSAAGTVSGDVSRLQQVVWNLLSNAIKFTPKGGRITVALSREKQQVQISVIDTGQGIAPEFLPHVFERFRQADPSSRRAQGGLGLGLAIVRHLIELQGGTVTACSPGVGMGATFTVQMPSVLTGTSQTGELKPQRARERNDSQPPRNLHNLRVLLIDDERDTRELISRAFRDSGATVAVGGSVDQALQLFEQLNPDVMISDIGMPGQDGFDLIRQIREIEARKGQGRVPAIALTAFAREEDRQRTNLAGFQMHVAKPVVPSELIDIVIDLVLKNE